jgi:hypothetical protein
MAQQGKVYLSLAGLSTRFHEDWVKIVPLTILLSIPDRTFPS